MPSLEATIAARRLIDEALLHHGAVQRDRLLALVRPGAIGAGCGADQREMAQMGGEPLMAEQTAWPVRPPYDRRFKTAYEFNPETAAKPRPLDFICEVDLAQVSDLHDLPLPRSGVLSFFYDAAIQPWGLSYVEMAGVRLLWQDALPSEMKREMTPDDSIRFRARPMSFGQGWMLPGWEQDQVESFAPFRSAECTALIEYEKEVRERKTPVGGFAEAGGVQVGGWPNLIQGPSESTCEALRLEGESGQLVGWPRRKDISWREQDWRLVLQVDSEWCMQRRAAGDAEMQWGDMGMLYLWMRYADILSRRFDQAILQLQCT